MSSDPSVEAHGAAAPPDAGWPGDPQPIDPNPWTPAGPPWEDEELPAPPERPPRQWRLVPRSLTGRLVVGVVSLVVVLVLATGIGTYYALRSFLIDRLDQQVETTASGSGSISKLFQPAPTNTTGPGVRAPQFVWAVAVGSDGTVLVNPYNASVEPMELSAGARRQLATRTSETPTTVRTTDGVQLRVTTRAVRAILAPDRAVVAVAIIGLSTTEVQNTLHRLLELELLIGASAVVIALVATVTGVRFSLRGLRRVTSTAQEVTAELSPEGAGLDRRVLVTEPGTEVGQLAESMNTLLAAVETQFAARLANEQRMRQFLADASHELRTPLTSIRGYAELTRMQRAQGSSEPADSLQRIESEGTRMSRLVDDLLTLARSDQGAQPESEPVDMAGLLEEAVSGARAAYPDRTIEFAAPTGLTVVGDRDQLLRVVRNLVTNSALHTRPDGPISVTAEHDGAMVIMRITDAGPGLPPEEAAHVFERFWRADKARSRARGGSGLGLAIVASVVAAHGGTVRFDSAVETGSTVTVRLPAGTG